MLTLQKESKKVITVSLIIVSLFLSLLALQNAVATLGFTELLATNVYRALEWVSWGATAAAIISGAGVGGVAVKAVWNMVKKKTLKNFVKW